MTEKKKNPNITKEQLLLINLQFILQVYWLFWLNKQNVAVVLMDVTLASIVGFSLFYIYLKKQNDKLNNELIILTFSYCYAR